MSGFLLLGLLVPFIGVVVMLFVAMFMDLRDMLRQRHAHLLQRIQVLDERAKEAANERRDADS